MCEPRDTFNNYSEKWNDIFMILDIDNIDHELTDRPLKTN